MTTRLNDLAISTTGNIIGNTVTANVVRTDNYQFANGVPFSGSSYANANVEALGESGWAGNIIPATSNLYSLGNSTSQWKDLYVSNATIYMNNVPVSLTSGNVLTVDGQEILSNNSNSTVSTTGNVSADYFFGNGSQLTGLVTTYGNANVAEYLPTYTGDLSANNVTVNNLYSPNYYSNAIVYANSTGYLTNINLFKYDPDTETLAVGSASLTGNVTANYFIGNGSQLTGLVTTYGNANVSDYLASGTNNANIITTGSIEGNIVAPGGNGQVMYNRDGIIGASPFDFNFDESTETLYVKVGSFSGASSSGVDALYAGTQSFVTLGSAVMAQFTGNIENYSQVNFQNSNDSRLASGDYIITADNGNDTTHFLDLGMTSSNWDGTQENSLGNLLAPNNGYLYVQDGNLTLGTKTGNTANVWTFDTTGNLNLPASGSIVGQTANNTGHINWVGNSSGDGYGYTTINLVPDNTVNDSYVILDPTAPNHIHIRAGGTQDNSGSQLYLGGETSHFKVDNGLNPNVYVTANSNVWTFDTTGVATLPGEGILQSLNDTVTLRSLNTVSGNANSVYLGTSGGLGFNDQEIGGNWLEIFRNGTEPEIRVPVGLGNLTIQTAEGVTPYNWVFDNTGNLNTPQGGYIGAAGVKGDGTMLTGGTGQIASLTSFYADAPGIYAGCFTANPDGTLNITTYGNGTGTLGQWVFASANLTVPGNSIISTANAISGLGGNSITITAGASDAVTWNSNPGGNLNLVGGYGSFGDGGGGPGGNVNITSGSSSDSTPGNVTINTSTNTWTFDNTGDLTLPTIILGAGLDEQTVVQSQRRLIPPFRYSAVIDADNPTVVYTATNVNTTSMKVTIQVQHTGLGMEFFEVFATYTGSVDTYYTVTNRVAPPTIGASTVVVNLNGSNTMQITVTINSGATTSWVTYDAVEFGIPQD